MPRAQFNEVLADSFRIDANGFADLDALLRASGAEVQYDVRRKDALEYVATEISDVLAEPNGDATQITRVAARLKDPNLELKLTFASRIECSASSTDRARLLQLTTDVKNLVRDRFGRGQSSVWGFLRAFLPVATLWLGLATQLIAYDVNQTGIDHRHDKAVAAYSQGLHRQDVAKQAAVKRAEAATRREAAAVEKSGSVARQLRFLVHQDAVPPPKLPTFPEPTYPRYGSQPLILHPLLMPIWMGVFFVLGLVLRPLVGPRQEGVFLLGAQINHREKMDRWRERLIWGVGVALGVGIVASLVAARL